MLRLGATAVDLTGDDEGETSSPIHIALLANPPEVLQRALPKLKKILENLLKGEEKFLAKGGVFL